MEKFSVVRRPKVWLLVGGLEFGAFYISSMEDK